MRLVCASRTVSARPGAWPELTTLFDLCLVVVDGRRPRQWQWLAPIVRRIVHTLSGADCTVGVLAVGVDVTAAAEQLGPLADHVAVLADPDGSAVRALGVSGAPALVWVTTEPAVRAVASGWDGGVWHRVVSDLARKLAWSRPLVPAPGDPPPVPPEPFGVVEESSDAVVAA
jgi:hypothetical protein